MEKFSVLFKKMLSRTDFDYDGGLINLERYFRGFKHS